MRRYLLNALVPARGTMRVFGPVQLTEDLAQRIGRWADASYIGHPATAALLGVAPSRGEAAPQAGDAAVVVRLRRRSPQPGADLQVQPEDLEAWFVLYGEDDSGILPPWQ